MKLAVITPVGPGHEELVKDAIDSVRVAKRNNTQFSSVDHIVVDDGKGEMGRGAARNIGMITAFADWYFFLDADDMMRPEAFTLCRFDVPAAFGSISLQRRRFAKNVHPCGWREIALHGSRGTLSMGFFCRADVARRLSFNETLDAGEDFDFYLRLDRFTKIAQPLVEIGYDLPSAGGPRGYIDVPWVDICNAMIVDAVGREPAKYDLRDNAVLEQAGSARSQSGDLSPALPLAQ